MFYAVPHLAVPDFRLERSGVYLEAKGYWTSADRKAFLALVATYPEREFRLVFQRAATRIGKGRRFPRTYGEWATKHGVAWCEGPSIPSEWLDEERGA